MTLSSSSSSASWGSREELLLACAVRRYGPLMWQIIAAEVSKRLLYDEGNCNNINNNSASAFFTPKECQFKYDELLLRFKRINCGGGGGGDCLTRMISELTRLRIQELKFLVRKQDLSIKKCELNLKKLQEGNKTTKPEVDSVADKGKRKRKGVNVVISPAATERKKRICNRLNKEEEKRNVDRKKRGKTDTDVIDKRLVTPEKEVKKKTVVRVGASDEHKVIVCGQWPYMAVAPSTAREPDSTKSRQVSRISKA